MGDPVALVLAVDQRRARARRARASRPAGRAAAVADAHDRPPRAARRARAHRHRRTCAAGPSRRTVARPLARHRARSPFFHRRFTRRVTSGRARGDDAGPPWRRHSSMRTTIITSARSRSGRSAASRWPSGSALSLSVREFGLLVALARSGGGIVRREDLYRRVWGGALRGGDRSIDVYIHKLRVKLEEALPDCALHPHARWLRLPLLARAFTRFSHPGRGSVTGCSPCAASLPPPPTQRTTRSPL